MSFGNDAFQTSKNALSFYFKCITDEEYMMQESGRRHSPETTEQQRKDCLLFQGWVVHLLWFCLGFAHFAQQSFYHLPVYAVLSVCATGPNSGLQARAAPGPGFECLCATTAFLCSVSFAALLPFRKSCLAKSGCPMGSFCCQLDQLDVSSGPMQEFRLL